MAADKSKLGRFTEDHLKLAGAVAHQAALAVEETRYHQALLQAERLAAIGQTIASLSHHIKNILQGLRSGSEILKMGLKDKDDRLIQQGWRVAEKNQGKIYDLVMDMLSYSKEREPAVEMTDLNAPALSGKRVAFVEPFTFISNDNKYEIEAYLTKPLALQPDAKYPLIVNIHGGPHGQQGPAFNFKNQVYAARGWATLMVNYRGSTGYGQNFADAVFGDQNGNEAQDVIYGVSAALRRNIWLDHDRLGVEGVSYGGQLSDWLITQTSMFKAAIPIAGISNLVSYNYMTYYNQYEQMEFGVFPHQGNLMDVMWERSALKHVAKARTPTLLMHGENDSDVPIAEAEQYYIALRDVGVETVMVRYPREGHGIREPIHIVDSIDRCIDWYVKHFH